MSLYDDAAFICLPTGGAVKNETVYNLKPEELLHSEELVINGDFTIGGDGTDGALQNGTYGDWGWNIDSAQQGAGATSKIANGVLTLTTGANAAARAYATNPDGSSNRNLFPEASGYFKLTYTVTSTTSDGDDILRVYFDGSHDPVPDTLGTHSIEMYRGDSVSNTLFLFSLIEANHSISIDNVSIKRIKQRAKDFTTFSRGSDMTATRVGADGMIQKGRKNLMFNTVFAGAGTDTKATGHGNSVVQGGTSFAPHSSLSDRIVFEVTDASGGSDRAFMVSNSFSSEGIYTSSVYVNAVTGTAPRVNQILGANAGTKTNIAYFENGIPISATDTISANKRYAVSVIMTGTLTMRFGLGTSSDIEATATVTLSKPQVERGQVPTSYIENKSTSAESAVVGMSDDEPRICYEGAIGGCPSLLLEPKRVNVVDHTEYFADSTKGGDFTLTNATIESCPAQKNDWFGSGSDLNTRSPEGLYNATLMTETAATGKHRIQAPQGFDNTEYYTLSIYAKKAGRDKFRVEAGNFTRLPLKVEFDLTAVTATNYTVGSDTGTGNPYIYDVGNGWYRCCIEGVQCGDTGDTGPNIKLVNGSSEDYAGDTGKGMLFYGYQIERATTSSPDGDGRCVTSYIPNYGAGSLTRNHDEAAPNNGNLDLADYMVGENVTWFVELAENRDIPRDYGGSTITISAAGNLGSLRIYRSATNQQRLTTVFQDKDGLFVPSGIEHTGTAPKFCITRDWGSGRIKVFHDGVEVKDDVNTNMERWNRILLDGESTPIRVKQIAAWDRVLTDQECIDLTS